MKHLRTLLQLAVGLLLGQWSTDLLHQHSALLFKGGAWSRPQLVGVALLLPVGGLLAVLVHELGHVLLGRVNGFVFHWLSVGPFKWQMVKGRLRFGWNTVSAPTGGKAFCVPAGAHDLRRRYLAYTAGGPLASALFAVVAMGTGALLPATLSGVGQVLGGALVLSGVLSAALGLITLLPSRTGSFYSDGSRLWNLWRNSSGGQMELAVLSVMAASMAGTRPRAWDRHLLDAAAALPQEGHFKLFVFHYLYLISLDHGQIAEADRYLSAYRERLHLMPAAFHGSVWLESAFFAAAYQHDGPAAGDFLDRVASSPYTPAELPARVDAALARLVGEADLARSCAHLSLQLLPKSLDPGSACFYAEWLNDTVHWAEQQECVAP